jgi:hypothetical protein
MREVITNTGWLAPAPTTTCREYSCPRESAIGTNSQTAGRMVSPRLYTSTRPFRTTRDS